MNPMNVFVPTNVIELLLRYLHQYVKVSVTLPLKTISLNIVLSRGTSAKIVSIDLKFLR